MIESVKEKLMHYWTEHKIATCVVGVVVVVLLIGAIT